MNFFRKFAQIVTGVQPKPAKPRVVAVWTTDPRTGKPMRVWVQSGDEPGSCTARPRGPLIDRALKRAA